MEVERGGGCCGSWDSLQDDMGVELRLGAVESGKRRLQQTLLTPLVPPVLISTQTSSQIEGTVRSQVGIHPLGEVEDLGRRESFPLSLFSLQPTLAAPAGARLPAPAPSLLLGSVPTGSLLKAADEKGQRHGEDDDAAHH